jgi:hypothetical protein
LKHPSNFIETNESQLTETTNCFEPAIHLFYAFALPDTDLIACAIGCPLINGTLSIGIILADMWSNIQFSQGPDKVFCIIVLISAKRYAPRTTEFWPPSPGLPHAQQCQLLVLLQR